MTDELTVLEFGRYKLFETPDGGWLLRRAVDICENCQACGCGEQADPVVIPGMLVSMAKSMQGNGGGLPAAMMRRLNGRGNGNGSGPGVETAESRGHSRRSRRSIPALGLSDQAADRGADPAGAEAASGV